jgi:hypothetical protein
MTDLYIERCYAVDLTESNLTRSLTNPRAETCHRRTLSGPPIKDAIEHELFGFDLLPDRQLLFRREMLGWFAGSAGDRTGIVLLSSRRCCEQQEKFGTRILEGMPRTFRDKDRVALLDRQKFIVQ